MNAITPVAGAADEPHVELRPADAGDAVEIARVWQAGWADGHLGHVPDELIEHRAPDTFESRTATRIADTTVAVDPDTGAVAGFVVVRDDEVEQIYVSAPWRGTDIAARLLAHAEGKIAPQHRTAWLAVVAGNSRARRFYERCGWHDRGDFDHVAETSDGTMVVPTRRYEKSVPSNTTEATQ